MTPELRALPLSFSDSCEISLSIAASVSGTSSPLFLPRLDTDFSTDLSALVAQCFPRFPSPSFPPVFSTSFPTYVTQDYSLPPTHMYLFSSYLAFPFVSSGYSDLFTATFASTDAPAFPRDSFASRFYRLGFEAQFLWPASRAEAPSHHSPGAAKITGLWVAHKHFANIAAVHWK